MTSTIKERGLLFKAPMVRAVQKGIKTQTRRLVKPQSAILTDQMARSLGVQPPAQENQAVIPCPYGAPGDRLWVREAWRTGQSADPQSGADLAGKGWPVFYEADGAVNWTGATSGGLGFTTPGRYRQARFMPRWASRILLEVTEVRVERLQDISEDDARAEGLSTVTKDGSLWKWGIPDADGLPGTDDDGWHWCDWERSPVAAYRRLWESIHGPGSWDLNPWVRAVSFRRIEA